MLVGAAIPLVVSFFVFVLSIVNLLASVEVCCCARERLRITPERWWVLTAGGSHTGLTRELVGAKVRRPPSHTGAPTSEPLLQLRTAHILPECVGGDCFRDC